ncbi:hypothetical protein CN068_06915 [Sinorhizobium meliloti]|nr:hypothetical protein CN215_09935 [Sinorhizobium meliloti]RVQ41685.1 hypothetical protein CN068_06915 [Sinorhizobium meliloti]
MKARDLLAWAISHEPTREAYRRSTGESIGPALDRYVAWLRGNIIGPAGADECPGGVPAPTATPTGTGVVVPRRISSR